MDAGSPGFVSVSEDVIRSDALKKLYTETSQYNCHVVEDVSLHELGNCLSEFPHIQDHQKLESKSILCQPSDKTGSGNVEKDDECIDTYQIESAIASEKCLSKCTTFPFSAKKASPAVSTEGDNNITTFESKQNGYESVKSAYHRSVSLPTPLKLVSAMKGSREKQGTPAKKLTVTWAPDVYDPLPSASTNVRIKRPSKKKYDKKNGKNKQKGKTSKGGGGSSKDKKQVQKYGGSSNKCYQSQNDNDKLLNCTKPSCAELGDFDVGSPDYCGSRFLKNSVTKLHFSVAEAT
ncbi:Membrane-associated protein like [Actinidia chinensis var. chinensis]|uniref:Membrane-associated protein like n=1 Tax=Actinidia chinensis var. chinensis TaxID=1590841 RepID=A0A2R6PWW4_ACTCC|nr:Membrane-associated protein like [Actinidia chinensis var. chinensis]